MSQSLLYILAKCQHITRHELGCLCFLFYVSRIMNTDMEFEHNPQESVLYFTALSGINPKELKKLTYHVHCSCGMDAFRFLRVRFGTDQLDTSHVILLLILGIII